MAIKEFKCDRCDEAFKAGSWFCKDEHKHTVPVKTYYVETEGLQGFYGPVSGDQVQNKFRKSFNFSRGTCTTNDPELQEHLDTYPACVSADAWRKSHLTADEREQETKRSQSRLEQTNTELLDEIKKLKEQAANSGKGK